jgi:CRISPR-associated protein Csm3
MPTLTLRGKIIITGAIEALTGLHIGGAAAGLDIGGIDNPVIRHPVTREPYIPGSSLRGKMRSLLDKHMGLQANKYIQRREPVVRVHECEQEQEYRTCAVCQIFGVTPGDQRREWTHLRPSRLLVRDVLLSQQHEATQRLREAKTDLPFTEVKWEAAIDRITAAAVPRQNERVPAGAIFYPFEMVYNLFDLNGSGVEDDIKWLPHVFKGMELLEDDYLGGYGSRGAGKVAFRDLKVVFKSRAYYEGKVVEPVVLGEGNSLRDLRPQQFAEDIRQHLGD